jgi:hypothetical protein
MSFAEERRVAAVSANTSRLRAQRLEKESAERQAAPPSKGKRSRPMPQLK